MTRKRPYFVPSMPPMMSAASDREVVNQALALFDRPEGELHQRVLDADADTDGFVDRFFGNITMPPS
jgi:hypothetical protein